MAHAFDRLKGFLDNVIKWLSANKLKLNPDKTEFIIFCTNINMKNSVNVLGTLLSPVGVVRKLGVWFDIDFSFSRHVQIICKSCFAHIRDLKFVRRYLTHHAALMAANALIRSRLGYCNSLFKSLSALDLRKLQCVQNSLARIVTNTTKYSHITPVRKTLLLNTVCLFNTVPYSRLPYWCTSSYIGVIQNILRLSFNLDTVSIRHVKAKLMVCFLRSHTLPLQDISPLSILASALFMMLQRFEMICLMMYVQLLLSTYSERSSKPISLHKHIHPSFSFSRFLSVVPTLAMSQSHDYSSLLFWFVAPRVCL